LSAEVRIFNLIHVGVMTGWNNPNASESAARQVEAYNGADTAPIYITTTTLSSVVLLGAAAS
jgi:hypothetical protein